MTTQTIDARPIPSTNHEPTSRRAAQLSGIGYLAVFVLAVIANFFVREGLVVSGDAAATFSNIAESETLFRFGLLAFLVIFVLDVGIAWGLHVVFEGVSRQVSLLAAWLRLTYTVLLGVAAVFFFVALELVSGAGHLTAFAQTQLESQVTLAVNAFNYTWMIGLLAFGFHLVVIAALMFRSSAVSRVFAALLAIAGTAYVIDTTAFSLLSNYSDHADAFLAMVAVPAVVAELGLTVWLLRGGFRKPGNA